MQCRTFGGPHDDKITFFENLTGVRCRIPPDAVDHDTDFRAVALKHLRVTTNDPFSRRIERGTGTFSSPGAAEDPASTDGKNNGQDGERQDLEISREFGHDEQRNSDHEGRDRRPQKKRRRRNHLDGPNKERKRQPPERRNPLKEIKHRFYRSVSLFLTELIASLAISAIPATDPTRLPASRGIMIVFELDDAAISPRASVYF